MIQYKCPKCGALLESPASLTGQYDECPLCHSKVPVPAVSAAPDAPCAPAGRRRWLLLGGCIAAGLVVAGCLAVAFWPSEAPTSGDNAGSIQAQLRAAMEGIPSPKFTATTREPVLLRYKFKSGERFEVTAGISMVINTQMGSRQVRIPTQMQMGISCEVEDISAEGNARVNMIFNRIAMEIVGPARTLKYDSDVDRVPPPAEMKYLVAMLNQKVPCTVTPRGKISDVNLHFMREALNRAGAVALFSEVEKTVNQSLQGSFIQLAEKPVSVGDAYDAGEITQKMKDIGTMTGIVRYEVLSVSGDKRNVLLKPIVQFKTDILPGSPVSIDSIDMDGWILFDCDRGNIDRSCAATIMKMSVSQNGQKATVTTDMVMKYQTR